ncbi:MAG: DUF502 domain-containing protein [Deltaproteobacteria bacterium]|nr:DUF502 domain-containing protein [Deltaproteobacteria bacterium]
MLLGKIGNLFKKYFITGFIVLVPLGATFTLLRWILTKADSFITVLPHAIQPKQLLGFDIPGLGVIITVLFIVSVGVLARLYFIRYFISLGERLIKKIPLIRSIYGGMQQLMEVMANKPHEHFNKVVMVEFPRKGTYAIGFITGVSSGECQVKTAQRVLNVFIPTTPNPTSGFYVMVPDTDIVDLEMSVEDAFKLIISGGMVTPKFQSAPKLTATPTK